METTADAVDWKARPAFEPMWGTSQLGDPTRLVRLLKCLEQAYELEARRLADAIKPGWIETMWERRLHWWATAVGIGVAIGLAAPFADLPEVMALAILSIVAWGVAGGAIVFLLFPMMFLRLDPTRPHWAKSGAPLDPGFLHWLGRSMDALGAADREKLVPICPTDAKSLRDSWVALKKLRDEAPGWDWRPGADKESDSWF